MIHCDGKRKSAIASTWMFLIIRTSAFNVQLPNQITTASRRTRTMLFPIMQDQDSRRQSPTNFHIIEQHFLKQSTNSIGDDDSSKEGKGRFQKTSLLWLYVNALRPVTILQAVGALLVGYLSISTISLQTTTSKPLVAAMLSVFLSYGSGMVVNDCVDASSDAMHTNKQDRAIASGQISQRSAEKYVGLLSAMSLLLAFGYVDYKFACWTLSNLIVMIGYAWWGWQRVFLIKNFICGWLAISPLIGASLLSDVLSISVASSASSLGWLAAVGFPMHVSREIIKDIEDVDVDRDTKRTLPIVVGEEVAHRIAYGIVAIVCGVMVLTPMYWKLFGPSPCYPVSVAIGMSMCARAYLLPIEKGQKLLKKVSMFYLPG